MWDYGNSLFHKLESMDRFRELSTFVAVAEEGAFNVAARRLHMSPPAVTRFVSALEARLNVQLVTRTTRHVALTDAGARLYSDAVRILSDLSGAEASAAGSHQVPVGALRITAPVMFGHRVIAPILRDYLDRYPAVTAHTLFVDRIVNMIEEGLDVALRIGELPDSSLFATTVGGTRRVTIAAPDYLARMPDLETPEALHSHRIILPTTMSDLPVWEFVSARRRQQVKLQPRLFVNTMAAAIDAALSGWGVTRVLSYQVADEITSGALVEVLRDYEDRQMPIHLLHAEGNRAAAKIRTFVDFAAKRLRADAARLAAL
jgi:DNA-binding transcriptional LysR family regulator